MMHGPSHYPVATHIDGSLIFQSAENRRREKEIADQIGAARNCTVHHFGALAVIDWWFERDGRMIGVADLKCRIYGYAKYDTVFLSVRKYLALQLAHVGLGVPAIFVVAFTDGTFFIRVGDVNGAALVIKNRNRFGTADSGKVVEAKRDDTEPMIEIPISQFKPIFTA